MAEFADNTKLFRVKSGGVNCKECHQDVTIAMQVNVKKILNENIWVKY